MKLLVLTERGGANEGRQGSLQEGTLQLGRHPSCGLRWAADEASVSRRHAVIRADQSSFTLADQDSVNGTLLNQVPLERPKRLASGDLIQLGPGGPRLEVRIEEVGAEPERAAIADLTLYNPGRHQAQPARSAVGPAVLVGMLVIGGAMGALTLLLTLFALGPGAALVGTMAAFAPVPVYLGLWLWLDRYDPEPAWALAGALAWGAGTATLVSGFANSLFGSVVFSLTESQELSGLLTASVSAPFIEEGMKGLGVLLIFLVLRREFDGVLDGVVYAGVVALGFAAVENVLYYGRAMTSGGAGALVAVFILRGVLGPFGHAVYTSMIGIGCGIARESHSTPVRWLAPAGGYLAAVLLHAAWNTLARFSGGLGGFVAVYVLLWVPLFLVFVGAVVWMGHRESRLLRRMLELEVGTGLITREQADIVASWWRRLGWLFAAASDRSRWRARRHFLHAATRLAFSYWHAERAAAAAGVTISGALVPVFRTEVARLADHV